MENYGGDCWIAGVSPAEQGTCSYCSSLFPVFKACGLVGRETHPIQQAGLQPYKVSILTLSSSFDKPLPLP